MTGGLENVNCKGNTRFILHQVCTYAYYRSENSKIQENLSDWLGHCVVLGYCICDNIFCV